MYSSSVDCSRLKLDIVRRDMEDKIAAVNEVKTMMELKL